MVSTGERHQFYSLSWGEFSTSLSAAVQSLRGQGDLVDVTLAAGGRSFPAHKIVLSAASPFLMNLLKETPSKHPVILLAGVASADLESLLEFVYRGEVSVFPSQLQSLLQAAQCLNIQGLSPGNINTEKPAETNPPPPTTAGVNANAALTRDVINSFLPIRRRKRAKPRDTEGSSASKWSRSDLENDTCTQEQTNHSLAHNSSHTGPNNNSESLANSGSTPNPDDSNADDLAEVGYHDSCVIKPPRGASDQPGVCPVCGATLRQARNLRRHLLSSCKYRSTETSNSPPGNTMLDPTHTPPPPSLSHYFQPHHNEDYSQHSEHIECRVSPPPPTPSPTTSIMCDNDQCFMPAQRT